MASNGLGTLFKITTFGESHGRALGVVVDGCPAGLPLTEEEIQEALSWRRPGRTPYTSPREEEDRVEILSGIFEGKTTGAPLCLMVRNQDIDEGAYASLQKVLRPGHATFTYLEKYGVFDYRGGGRASARETLCRVAAGAVAKKLLRYQGIDLVAYVKAVGGIVAPTPDSSDLARIRREVQKSPVFCEDRATGEAIARALEKIMEEGDSWGGVIELVTSPLPIGLGDPLYEKLEANLAKAMMTLPASKGVEIGEGFAAAEKRGSEHNDPFVLNEEGAVVMESNHAGGTLGGISTGMPLLLRVAFKPTSSIKMVQKSVTTDKKPIHFTLPEGARHDPCVALRAVPVVEAMGALVLVDAYLMQRSVRL